MTTINRGNIGPHSPDYIVVVRPRCACLTIRTAPYPKGIKDKEEWLSPSGWAFVDSPVKNRISFLPPCDLNSSLTSLFFRPVLGNVL